MDFANKIVCRFTTKHPDQRTVLKPQIDVLLAQMIWICTCKRLLAVLHKFSTCAVNNIILHIVIPSSLTSLLDFTLLFSIINVILLLSMFDPRNIIWNLLGFATMLLILNQLRIKCVPLDNFRLSLQNLVSMNILLCHQQSCKLTLSFDIVTCFGLIDFYSVVDWSSPISL